MKKLALSLLTLLISLSAIAQNDSLQNEILQYKDKIQETVSKGRKLLLDKFMEEDMNKVREIREYLVNSTRHTDYLAFYAPEYWLLQYWTQDYAGLASSLTNKDSLEGYYSRHRMVPQRDLLFEKVYNKTIGSMIELETLIGLSDLEPVDKEFLQLNLRYLITSDENPLFSQDELNKHADKFLYKYPNSEYEWYVRETIRYVVIPSKWAFTFEFFSGFGWLTDQLAQTYMNNVPVGVAFDVYYKKWALYLRDYIGFSKTRIDIPYENGTWEKGSQVRVFLPEATIGYVVFDGPRLKAAPFGGISSTDIGPTSYDQSREPDLEKVRLSFTTTYTVGVNIDAKIGWSNPETSYGFIRLRYGYNTPQFSKKYVGASGDMHYLTLGIGGLSRKSRQIR